MASRTSGTTRQISTVLLAAGALFCLASPAAAAGVQFFSSSTPPSPALANNTTDGSTYDNSSNVQSYMDSLLHSQNSSWNVSVSGAESSGTTTGPGYTGDGHVVCQGSTSGSSCTADTLATIYKTPFIMTSGAYTTTSGGTTDNAIQMVFSGGIKVSSVAFNYEIFPDGSTNQPPDFAFVMTSGANTIENQSVNAVAPGTGNSTIASGSNAYGTYAVTEEASAGTANVDSAALTPETNSQAIGTMTFNFSSPITNPTLTFIDWPADIAVSNIQFGLPSPPPSVPEPASMLALGTALMAMEMMRRRRYQRA